MHDCDNFGLIRADEQNVIAVLPPGDCAHVPTLERMTGPEFRRKLPLKVRGILASRNPRFEKTMLKSVRPTIQPFSGGRTRERSDRGVRPTATAS
jgi:hypothetical protein